MPKLSTVTRAEGERINIMASYNISSFIRYPTPPYLGVELLDWIRRWDCGHQPAVNFTGHYKFLSRWNQKPWGTRESEKTDITCENTTASPQSFLLAFNWQGFLFKHSSCSPPPPLPALCHRLCSILSSLWKTAPLIYTHQIPYIHSRMLIITNAVTFKGKTKHIGKTYNTGSKAQWRRCQDHMDGFQWLS